MPVWPFARLTTYLSGSLPAIKALDLNDFQDYIVGLFSGTKSIKSLWVDGVGDVASAVAAGTVRALLAVLDTNGNGTTAPTTSFPLGTMTKDMIPIGWAHVSVSGGVAALVRGVNVNAIAYIGGGTTNVTFNPTVSNATDCICLASTATQDRTIYATPANSGGKLQVQVVTRSLAPASVDTTFFVAAWGS